MKNFIVENKKKIRSRSRNNERKNLSQGGSTRQRGILKKVKDTVFSDEKAEFAMYVDQGVQTQYLDFDLRELSNQMSTIAIVPASG